MAAFCLGELGFGAGKIGTTGRGITGFDPYWLSQVLYISRQRPESRIRSSVALTCRTSPSVLSSGLFGGMPTPYGSAPT